MKKLIMFLFVIGLGYSSWQVYNPITKTLTVHLTADPLSEVYYRGGADGYYPALDAMRGVWNAPYPMPGDPGNSTTTPAF